MNLKNLEEYLKKNKDKFTYLVFYKEQEMLNMYNIKVIQNSIIHTINFLNTSEKEFFEKDLDVHVLKDTILFDVTGKEKEIFKEFQIQNFPCILKIKDMELINFAPHFTYFKVD